jgi:hypothetical protein
MIAATGNEVSGLGGIFALLLALVFIVLAVLWIAFPLIGISKFNDLLKIQREKALQWMVDNWRKD